MDKEFNEINQNSGNISDEITPEMMEQVEIINTIINTEIIDTTTALNILVNVATSLFHNEALNDLDRTLISKALESIQHTVDKGEDFFIKVTDE